MLGFSQPLQEHNRFSKHGESKFLMSLRNPSRALTKAHFESLSLLSHRFLHARQAVFVIAFLQEEGVGFTPLLLMAVLYQDC